MKAYLMLLEMKNRPPTRRGAPDLSLESVGLKARPLHRDPGQEHDLQMAEVFKVLRCVFKPPTFYGKEARCTECGILVTDLEKVKRTVSSDYYFTSDDTGQHELKRTRQNFEEWLVGLPFSSQQDLSAVPTEDLRSLLSKLAQDGYIGTWEPTGGSHHARTTRLVPEAKTCHHSALLLQERRRKNSRRKVRRGQLNRLTLSLGKWLERPPQHWKATELDKHFSLHELQLLQDATKGFKVLTKDLDDLQPWK
jgi:hypothetical protein